MNTATSGPGAGPAPRTRLEIALGNVALAAAAGLLIAGILAPLLTVRRLWVFSDTVTLAAALGRLLDEGQLALFVLLFGFSVLFPIAKLGCLFWAWNASGGGSPRARHAVAWLTRVGRWSMLDVFVVALLVVTVKLRWVADVEVRYGLHLFGGSVLLTMLLGGLAVRAGGGDRALPAPMVEAGSPGNAPR